MNHFFKLLFSIAFFYFAIAVEAQKVDNRISKEEASMQKVFIEAMLEKTLENYDKSETLLLRILGKDGDNSAVAFELAKIYFVQKKDEKAIQYAKKAYDLESDNIWYGKLYIDLLERGRAYKKAVSVLQEVVERESGDLNLKYKLASLHVRTGKVNEALKVFDDIEKKIGFNEDLAMMKYQAYMSINKTSKAESVLQQLVKTYPLEVKFRHQLADHYVEEGNKDKAGLIYHEILEISPSDGKANVFLAQSYKATGQDEKYLNAIGGLFSNPMVNMDVKVGELFPYIEKVRLTKDEELKNTILESARLVSVAHPEDAKAYSLYGDILYHARQSEEALVAYNKAIEINPSVFSIWEQVLYINGELKRADDLVEMSEKAMDLFPNQASVYYLNGMGYGLQKKHKEAIDPLKQSLMMAGNNESLRIQIFSELGNYYYELGDHEESDKSFEKALEINPNDPYILNNFAYFLSLRAADMEKAKGMAELANKLAPNYPSYQDTYAWILFQEGAYEEAKEWLGKAIKNGGDKSPEILEHYGDTLFKLGQVEEAVAEWKKAKEAGSKSTTLQSKIDNKRLN